MVRLGHSTISDDLLSAETRKSAADPAAARRRKREPPRVGSTSYFAVLPELDLVISVMMNEGEENLGALAPEATRLLETFVAASRAAPEPSEIPLLDP